jgi:hypothetical protein
MPVKRNARSRFPSDRIRSNHNSIHIIILIFILIDIDRTTATIATRASCGLTFSFSCGAARSRTTALGIGHGRISVGAGAFGAGTRTNDALLLGLVRSRRSGLGLRVVLGELVGVEVAAELLGEVVARGRDCLGDGLDVDIWDVDDHAEKLIGKVINYA